MIKTKSVFSPIEPHKDGLRILASRFRGRGLPTSRYDVWMANLGPSEVLLKDILADRIRWSEFTKRYRQELFECGTIDQRNQTIKNLGQKFTLRLLQKLAEKNSVTLLCQCAEEELHCIATCFGRSWREKSDAAMESSRRWAERRCSWMDLHPLAGGVFSRRPTAQEKSMKTTRTTLLIALAAAAISLARAQDNDAKKDLAQLQGEWTMVSGSADGQDMPEQMRKQMKRVCKGDEATTTMGGQVFLKAKIKLDPSKKPKAIDYEMTDGFTKGKKQLGIYEVDGDTFKSCFSKPGEERPASFESKPGEGRTLSVWKRLKSEKTEQKAAEQKEK